MSRVRASMSLTRNAVAAFNANAQPHCSISTQNVIEKTKDIVSSTATATMEAAKAAKDTVVNLVGGPSSKGKANQRINNAKELAKEDYIAREKTNDQYGPGSFGEQIGKQDKANDPKEMSRQTNEAKIKPF
uniref:Uncharacterized protein n=1 Tax=Plectus sambesii TaxID=2011161 RepID=A0A914W8A6_9BILA